MTDFLPAKSLPAPQPKPLTTGWAFPPSFDRLTGSVNLSSDMENIRENLQILFSTDLGERIMLPTYGARLREHVFSGLTQTLRHQFIMDIANVIAEWEPRVTVLKVDITESDVFGGGCEIMVDFQLRGTASQGRFIHSFPLADGAQSPPLG
jgi:phage baseplate assembly protein W